MLRNSDRVTPDEVNKLALRCT